MSTLVKQEAPFFIQVRNKVISLISFAIKDNINVENQYLVDFDDCYTEEGQVRYARKTFYSSEPTIKFFIPICIGIIFSCGSCPMPETFRIPWIN